MSTFGEATAATDLTPLRTVTLPPSAWREGPAKPQSVVTMGVRVLGEGQTLALRKAAYESARVAFPDLETGDDLWDEHYNQALMLGAACDAVCNATDRTKPWHPQQRTLLPAHIARGGLERIWDELEELTIETSPTGPEATSEDLARLTSRLSASAPFGHLSPGDARALRRLLRHAVDRLTPPTA